MTDSQGTATPQANNFSNNTLSSSHTPQTAPDNRGIENYPEALVEALPDIPQNWRLTPVNQKRPMRPHWATEAPLSRGELAHQLLNGTAINTEQGEYTQEWDGFGLRTGNGLIGIDVDGPSAQALLATLSGEELPQTPSWTSNKPGRLGMVYRLSEATQALITAAGGWGGKKLIADPSQELDFRYDGKMQVLPPSAHPETGQYRWLVSPQDVEVAPAPQWLEDFVVQRITQQSTPVTQRSHSNNVTPVDWPLLPPIAITGPGETNDVLRQLANWGHNKLGKTSVEELGEYITTQAPKLPGWKEFASVKSKQDLAKHKNAWGYRWAKSCIKYWTSPKAQHSRTAPDTQWQDWLHAESISRLQWCIDQAQTLGKKFYSQNQTIQQFNLWAKEKFGRGFSKSTLLKAKERWINLLTGSTLETPPPPDQAVQNVPNAAVPYQQENQGVEGGTGLTAPPPEPQSPTELQPIKGSQTPQLFRKGDRVVFDDGTGLSYCGRVATVQAKVKDPLGNTCYRLDIDYQGRRHSKARKIEALPSFLRPLPNTISSGRSAQRKKAIPTVSGTPQATKTDQRNHPTRIKAHWTALQAVLGEANPFGDGEWEVRPADIGQVAFQRLINYLAQGEVAPA